MRNSRCLVHLGLGLAGLLPLSLQAALPVGVLAPEAKVAGVSQSEYVVRWWQWANRVPPGVRPYQDPTGAQCGLNQSGEVWFLANTDGTAEVVRHCTMPAGKHVFLPIINMIAHSRPGKPVTCDQANAIAAANNEHLIQAEVTIDGKIVPEIARHRLSTPGCFDAFPVAPYLEKTSSYFPAATDGYWLMLEPLPAGVHWISVEARYGNPGTDQGDLEQVFEYELQVEDVPPEEPVKQEVDQGIYVELHRAQSSETLSLAPPHDPESRRWSLEQAFPADGGKTWGVTGSLTTRVRLP